MKFRGQLLYRRHPPAPPVVAYFEILHDLVHLVMVAQCVSGRLQAAIVH